MNKSKEWNWEKNKEKLWLEPSIESYYYCSLWKEKSFMSILDLGCGLGRHSILFSRNGFNVTSCDLSSYAVNSLNEWACAENLCIKTDVCDMKKMPYENDSFNCIFSYHTISHTDTLGAFDVIKEIKRVLKIDGEIFITLCSKDTWSFKEAGYPKIDDNTVIKIEDGPENGIPHFYVDYNDVLNLLIDFEIITIRHIDDIYHTDKLNHSMHYFIHARLINK